MKTNKYHIYRPHSPLPAPADLSRRRFISQSTALVAASPMAAGFLAEGNQLSASRSHLATNTLGFNGERQDPATGLYPLGKGYRLYNPAMMRFHASDSLSPFGQGGINAYAYSLGDPINLRDPSGHFALFGILIGTIVGAAIGAAISATAEGAQSLATRTHFNWKNVAIGSGLGLISAGFGATASLTTKTIFQIGMAVADQVVSGTADFGLSVAAGTSTKQAGINAGIGAVIGLVTLGTGIGIGRRYLAKRGTASNSYDSRINYDDFNGIVNTQHLSLISEIISLQKRLAKGEIVTKVSSGKQLMDILNNGYNAYHKFILTKDGELSVSSQLKRRAISHPAIASTHKNKCVISAGWLSMNANLIEITNRSGHYKPSYLTLGAIERKLYEEFKIPRISTMTTSF